MKIKQYATNENAMILSLKLANAKVEVFKISKKYRITNKNSPRRKKIILMS